MASLISSFSGHINDAITIGAIIGALAGIVAFTAPSVGEGIQRVIAGFIIGGVIMGLIQAVTISQAAGVGAGGQFNPLLQSGVGRFGGIAYRGIMLTIQAALAGGLLMVISLAPFRAFKGALAGVIIGTIAAFLAWGALQYLNTQVPLVIFYILILGLVLFIIENIPARS